MDCTNYILLLNDLIDGIISDDDNKMLSEHMAACKSCRTYYENLKVLKSESSKLSFEKLPANFESTVLGAVQKQRLLTPISGTNMRRYIFNTRFMGSVAAVAVIAVAIHFAGSYNTANINLKDGVSLSSIGVIENDDSQKLKEDIMEPVSPGEDEVMDDDAAASPAQESTPAPSVQSNSPEKKQSDESAGTVSGRERTAPQNPQGPAPPSNNDITGADTFAAQVEDSKVTEKGAVAETAAPKPTPSDKPLPASTVSPPASIPALSVDTTKTGSLLKRKITFVIISENQAETALSVFNANSASVSSVRSALNNANIMYTERETISEDYTQRYNTLAQQASDLKSRLKPSLDNGTIESYSSQIYSLRSQMDALKSECAKVEVGISIK